MNLAEKSELELRQLAYELPLTIQRMQQEIDEVTDPAVLQPLLENQANAVQLLHEAEQALLAFQAQRSAQAISLTNSTSQPVMRGAETTGLTATIKQRMAHVPTATYHLLNQNNHPLITCDVTNHGPKKRRICVTSFIEGYSANAVDSTEIAANATATFDQLPTLFPERIRELHELTRAMLHVRVEDMDGKVELQKSEPIWLLARNSAPLAVRDPSTGTWNDLSRYLGAFVTPNEPSVMKFLRKAAQCHPEGRLYGYQQAVGPQVDAIFTALKNEAKVTYVNSVINFNPEASARTQRVRLPRQSLEEQQANCIDGALLFASLLEAASLNPALVIVPGHAFVAWESGPKNDQWEYLETTMIGTNTFAEAVAIGTQKATVYSAQVDKNPNAFKRWSVRELRTVHAITPLE